MFISFTNLKKYVLKNILQKIYLLWRNLYHKRTLPCNDDTCCILKHLVMNNIYGQFKRLLQFQHRRHCDNKDKYFIQLVLLQTRIGHHFHAVGANVSGAIFASVLFKWLFASLITDWLTDWSFLNRIICPFSLAWQSFHPIQDLIWDPIWHQIPGLIRQQIHFQNQLCSRAFENVPD